MADAIDTLAKLAGAVALNAASPTLPPWAVKLAQFFAIAVTEPVVRGSLQFVVELLNRPHVVRDADPTPVDLVKRIEDVLRNDPDAPDNNAPAANLP